MTLKTDADKLEQEFSPSGEGIHPFYWREDWRQAVADEDTLLGYWEWVAQMLREEET